MGVRHAARGGGADRVEVPDHVVELEQQLAVALDRHARRRRRRAPRDGSRRRGAPRRCSSTRSKKSLICPRLSYAALPRAARRRSTVLRPAGTILRIRSHHEERSHGRQSSNTRMRQSSSRSPVSPSASPWPACARPTAATSPWCCSSRARRSPASSPPNRFCAAPVQVCREHLAAGSEVRAIARQHRQRQRRHRRRRPGPRPLDLRRAGAPARLRAGAGAAVLHRRDHGDAAERPHRGRPAGGDRRRAGRRLGRTPPRRS